MRLSLRRIGNRGVYPDFYQKQYPRCQGQDQSSRRRSPRCSVSITRILSEMRVSWQAYPTTSAIKNSRLLPLPRRKHASADGKTVSHKCDTCHEFLERTQAGGLLRAEASPAFAHHGSLPRAYCAALRGLSHRRAPSRHCRGCHGSPNRSADGGHAVQGVPSERAAGQAAVTCATCHGDLAGLHQKIPHKDAGCVACHAPHSGSRRPGSVPHCHGDRLSTTRAACFECHDYRPTSAAGKPRAIPAKGGAADHFLRRPNSPGLSRSSTPSISPRARSAPTAIPSCSR